VRKGRVSQGGAPAAKVPMLAAENTTTVRAISAHSPGRGSRRPRKFITPTARTARAENEPSVMTERRTTHASSPTWSPSATAVPSSVQMTR
jgi:hypothetical protein